MAEPSVEEAAAAGVDDAAGPPVSPLSEDEVARGSGGVVNTEAEAEAAAAAAAACESDDGTVDLDVEITSSGVGGAGAFAAAVASRRAAQRDAGAKSPLAGASPIAETSPDDGLSSATSVAAKSRASSPGEDTLVGRAISRRTGRPFSPGHVSKLQSRPKGYADIHGHKMTETRHRGAKIIETPTKMPLRDLKKLIEELYEARSQQPEGDRQSIERFMRSFIDKRYVYNPPVGLIVHAIDYNSSTDCDVAVFSKILRNQLPEHFPAMQHTLRASVDMLFRKQVRLKNAGLEEAELAAVWRGRIRRGVPVAEAEEIVRYMYNDKDSQAIMRRLWIAAKEWENQSEHLQKNPDSLRYRDFVQTLLRFQMSITEKLYADIAAKFAKVDVDCVGTLCSNGLDILCAMLSEDVERQGVGEDIISTATNAASDILEERRLQQATFTDCTEIFEQFISARWMAPKHARSASRASRDTTASRRGLSNEV
eukprot:TRINITY_DN40269_c0_g1_i2.p1 TRINITY_DN40269_c0_g1~~TRINITY_DN40269_c0_g1_i2.p1  ORF type:complete len:481 (+),score=110.16 TRINITY_DN40269_c0_g1_i2:126-1568(+)